MGEGKKENKVTREFSSGGVVYRKEKNKILWLVTKSAVSDLYPKAVWRLPKGWIDEGEKAEEAALREVREEGGVEAKIIQKIETIRYFFTTSDKTKILKFVTFYLTEWAKDLPEGFDEETSEIAWLSYEEAYKKLSFSGEKQVLKKAKELLNSV
ncbi:MAG: NUDIX domain-containing protein [Candidatus Woesebacteria bacterium]|nr:NUDIX domain-containing protein [Candidatus Woesebacteria bacterium]